MASDTIHGRAKDAGNFRLLLSVMYRGPFEILDDALMSIDNDGEIIIAVAEGSLRYRMSVIADRLNYLWREWYVLSRRYPARAWRRW